MRRQQPPHFYLFYSRYSMNSFDEFLNTKLLEDVSREGQIAQYEKSLSSLAKIRIKLMRNGMDTTDIDKQMTTLHSALNRRNSSTNKWHGYIIRIDQEPINNVSMWRLMTSDGLAFHIPVKDAFGIVKIPHDWQKYPNPKRPISKFVEYRQEVFGYNVINLITYTENRTVDIVPFRTTKEESQYFLIKRRNSGMWATVGGHINEGELDNPINAARRELHEETGAQPLVIRQLPSGWIREVVSNPETNPSAEYNSWTLPFIAIIDPKFEMSPADDAVGGAWFNTDEAPHGLHFSHHKEVIRKAIDYLPTLLKQFGKH